MALVTEEERLPGRVTLRRPAAVPVARFLHLTEVTLSARFFTKWQSLKNSWPDLCSVPRGPIRTLKPPPGITPSGHVLQLFEVFSNQEQIRAGASERRRNGEGEAMAGGRVPGAARARTQRLTLQTALPLCFPPDACQHPYRLPPVPRVSSSSSSSSSPL